MVRIVYAHWVSHDNSPPPYQAELVTLWRRTWMAAGWTPRVLIGDKAPKKSWYHAPVSRMNLSWKAGRARRPGDLMDFSRDASAKFVIDSMFKHARV